MAETAPRLYVSNLPYVAQKVEIERLFADSNVPFKSIDISIDPFSGRNPSYCFVDFRCQYDADQAMQTMQGQIVRDRPIKINFKTKRREKFGQARLPTSTHGFEWRARTVPGLDVNSSAYVYNRWSRDDAASHWTAPCDEGRRLFVGGLPRIPHPKLLNAEMRVLFQGWSIEAVSKLIWPHEDTRSLPGSHNYCFVDVSSAHEAQGAADMLDGRATPHGGRYKVRLARWPPEQPTKVMREQLRFTGKEREEPSSPRRDLRSNWRRLD